MPKSKVPRPPKGWKYLNRGTITKATDKILMYETTWMLWGKGLAGLPVRDGIFIRRITKRKGK